MIDLHTHSTFSDGSLTPEALVDLACEAGLTAVGLTDHDCTDGHARFMAACAKRGIVGVPGVEISANVERGTLHMLGFFVDGCEAGLRGVLKEIRDGRSLRNERILARLNGLGIELRMDEVAAYAGEDTVGRPHFAEALLAKGAIKTRQEAFDKYLARGRPAYVDRFRLSAEQSIAAIHGAGGLAVLAHPFTLELDDGELAVFAGVLARAGLDGMEAYYSEYTKEQQKKYLKLADDLGLAVSGGSDFHGAMNESIRMGVGFGSLRVPDEALAGLVARRAARTSA